jgi:hypothetical protein
MLELRPSCQHCDAPLPPDARHARICSFECTYCAECVDGVLEGICPNCGGDFVPRPIRPVTNWKGDNHLARYPASVHRRHRPVDLDEHARLTAVLREIAPERR